MSFQRASGILLHPTSLPSPGGIGDLGAEAYAFADFLFQGKQGLWQILPLSPPGLGNSPYSAISAFAGNPLLVSLDRLVEHGWLDAHAVCGLPIDGIHIDYELVNRDRRDPPPLERDHSTQRPAGDQRESAHAEVRRERHVRAGEIER